MTDNDLNLTFDAASESIPDSVVPDTEASSYETGRTCPACGGPVSHTPAHRDGEDECFNDDCWMGSFFPNRRSRDTGVEWLTCYILRLDGEVFRYCGEYPSPVYEDYDGVDVTTAVWPHAPDPDRGGDADD